MSEKDDCTGGRERPKMSYTRKQFGGMEAIAIRNDLMGHSPNLTIQGSKFILLGVTAGEIVTKFTTPSRDTVVICDTDNED